MLDGYNLYESLMGHGGWSDKWMGIMERALDHPHLMKYEMRFLSAWTYKKPSYRRGEPHMGSHPIDALLKKIRESGYHAWLDRPDGGEVVEYLLLREQYYTDTALEILEKSGLKDRPRAAVWRSAAAAKRDDRHGILAEKCQDDVRALAKPPTRP